MTSSTTASKRRARASGPARSGFEVACTSCPALSKVAARTRRMSGSSSTSRILAIGAISTHGRPGPGAASGAPAPPARRAGTASPGTPRPPPRGFRRRRPPSAGAGEEEGRQLAALAEAPAELGAVEPRQGGVDDRHVRQPVLLDPGERRLAGAAGGDREAGPLERVAQHAALVGVGVHAEDARVDGPHLVGGCHGGGSGRYLSIRPRRYFG